MKRDARLVAEEVREIGRALIRAAAAPVKRSDLLRAAFRLQDIAEDEAEQDQL